MEDGKRIKGTLTRIEPDHLLLVVGIGNTRMPLRSEILKIHGSKKTRGPSKNGPLIGLAVGLAVGVWFGSHEDIVNEVVPAFAAAGTILGFVIDVLRKEPELLYEAR